MKQSPMKPTVCFDDLEKLDVRVGTIRGAQSVTGSHRFVELTVDFGRFTRRILVGLKAERYEPDEIRGRQAQFVVNLEPRKLAGGVCGGMLFDVGHAKGITPMLAVPERPVRDGASAGDRTYGGHAWQRSRRCAAGHRRHSSRR
jgi:tRNA-binding protein